MKTPLLFDVKLMRPACALLQAASGGCLSMFQKHFGGLRNWLLVPTDGMRMMLGSDEEWAAVAAICEEKSKKKSR